MTQRVPWSVKGITREDRELAKAAAQAAGLSVGAWLTAQIRQAAETSPPAVPSETSQPTAPSAPAPTHITGTAAPPPAARFAFGAGRWQRAAAMPPAKSVAAPPEPGAGGRDPGETPRAEPAADRPPRTGTDGIDWHDQVAADETSVDGLLGELRADVAQLRAARAYDREQITQALGGVMRRLADVSTVLTTVEADVATLRQTVDDLARRPAAGAAGAEDGGQIHAALSTTAQAIMRLAVRLDHLETRQPAPGFWRRLLGGGGKPPPKSRGRRTTQRRVRK